MYNQSKSSKNIFFDKNFWLNATPFILSLLMVIFVVLFAKFLPSRLPLFYSLSWGDNQLANRQQLLIIPAVISLVSFLNLIVSWQLHHSQVLFKKILNFLSLLTTLILTISFLKIILIFI